MHQRSARTLSPTLGRSQGTHIMSNTHSHSNNNLTLNITSISYTTIKLQHRSFKPFSDDDPGYSVLT